MSRLFIVSLILMIVSCQKKNEVETIEEVVVSAGSSIDLYTLTYDPAIVVKGIQNGTNDDYYFSDSASIDITNDGKDDLKFNYYKEFKEVTCTPPLDCVPTAIRNLHMSALSDMEIACEQETTSYIKVFNYGDKIEDHSIWKAGNDLILRMDNFGPSGNGSWYEKNGYVGVRKTQNGKTSYGWVYVSTVNDQIEIRLFAIEK